MALNILLRNASVLRRNTFTSPVFFSSKSKDANNANKNEEVTKESLQWRIPWAQEKDVWYSKLKAFGSDYNNTDIIRFLQSPIDFRPSTIKRWWKRRQEEIEICTQQYIPERNQILGDDLAASHFIVFRGGAVKFFGDDTWIKQKENLEYELPNVYVPNKIVQAIDCSNMQLHYEGLENLRGLKKLKWLSLNNSQYIDDWCIDRICGIFRDTLEYLDIRNCKNITDRGVSALYKTTKLKTLYIDDFKLNKSMELTCLMLQELLPKLEIKM